MLPDLSSHLHTLECNFLIDLYKECEQQKPFAKIFGGCSYFHEAVWQCLTKEREFKRSLNKTVGSRNIGGYRLPESLYTPVLKKLKEEGSLNFTQSEGCKI
ncbi:unnamed protein product [Dracunculus medinensis]|uniref:COX assembly mitochondrial protein n=1 Tax=Dracunculus medinensis TaxID=318479 RepID=A0A0N4UKV5_DRAME|nr:unnamed protein product [Dracunculus medinensis]